jgi:hypothetical protein
VTKNKEQLDLEYNEAHGRLANAQAEEAAAGWGTAERAEAHSRVRQAEDDIARIDHQLANPEQYEEQVRLIAPVGTEEVMARSRAERLAKEFGYYEIRPLKESA